MNLVSLCAFSVKKFEILDETNFEWNVSYLCIYNISWNENWKVCRLSVISINGLVAILASATIRLNSDAVWDQHQGSINSPVFSHLNFYFLRKIGAKNSLSIVFHFHRLLSIIEKSLLIQSREQNILLSSLSNKTWTPAEVVSEGKILNSFIIEAQ